MSMQQTQYLAKGEALMQKTDVFDMSQQLKKAIHSRSTSASRQQRSKYSGNDQKQPQQLNQSQDSSQMHAQSVQWRRMNNQGFKIGTPERIQFENEHENTGSGGNTELIQSTKQYYLIEPNLSEQQRRSGAAPQLSQTYYKAPSNSNSTPNGHSQIVISNNINNIQVQIGRRNNGNALKNSQSDSGQNIPSSDQKQNRLQNLQDYYDKELKKTPVAAGADNLGNANRSKRFSSSFYRRKVRQQEQPIRALLAFQNQQIHEDDAIFLSQQQQQSQQTKQNSNLMQVIDSDARRAQGQGVQQQQQIQQKNRLEYSSDLKSAPFAPVATNTTRNSSAQHLVAKSESENNIEEMHFYAVEFQQNCKKWLSKIELQEHIVPITD